MTVSQEFIRDLLLQIGSYGLGVISILLGILWAMLRAQAARIESGVIDLRNAAESNLREIQKLWLKLEMMESEVSKLRDFRHSLTPAISDYSERQEIELLKEELSRKNWLLEQIKKDKVEKAS